MRPFLADHSLANGNASAVDQAMQAAKRGERNGNRILGTCFVGDVGPGKLCGRPKVGGKGVSLRVIDVGENDLATTGDDHMPGGGAKA